MGVSISWVAFKGIDRETGLARLNFATTAKTAALGDDDVTGGELADGWYLVVADECDNEILASTSLSALTVDCEAVSGSVEEHVMYAACEHWRNGRRLWRIVHESEKSGRHIEALGELPAMYHTALATAKSGQDSDDAAAQEVDHYFDIPLEVAKSIAGFKHDDVSSGFDDEHMTVLARIGAEQKRSWWQVWK